MIACGKLIIAFPDEAHASDNTFFRRRGNESVRKSDVSADKVQFQTKAKTVAKKGKDGLPDGFLGNGDGPFGFCGTGRG